MQPENWRVIRPTNVSTNRFLAAWHFGKDRYQVKLTDLTSVWAESLQSTEIISRAQQIACPIDLAEDSHQIGILLQKLENALLSVEETEILLDLNNDDNSVTLTCASPLPKPLNSLRWPIHLHKLPHGAVASEIIMPIMCNSLIRQHQINDLEDLLRAKDNAITKLVDKVESMGVDLPSLLRPIGNTKTGKKPMSRQELFNHTPGLATFQKESWEAAWNETWQQPATFEDIVKASFSKLDENNVQSMLDRLRSEHADFKKDGMLNIDAQENSLSSVTQESLRDDFEVQSVPVRMNERLAPTPTTERSRPKPSQESLQLPSKALIDDDESTESESEIVEDPRVHKQQPNDSVREQKIQKDSIRAADPTENITPSPPKVTSTRRLGLIGKSQASKIEQNNPSSKPESDSNEDNADNVNPGSHEAVGGTHRRKLGVIGGGRKPSKPLDGHAKPAEDELSTEADRVVNTAQVDAHKPSDITASGLSDKATDTALRVTAQEEEEEDIQRKADKKRQELKRNMEGSNKTTPKKKRKF